MHERGKYNVNLKLKHSEILEKIDLETGEITSVKINKTKENGMIKFDLMDSYHRRNTKAWELLRTQTTDKEYKVADKLANMAKAYTNSLEPLCQDSTVTEVSLLLEANRNTVMNIIEKLFKLGVIGKWEVCERDERHMKYFVFNPYLSFNGNVIKKNVPGLFDGTTYALIMR